MTSRKEWLAESDLGLSYEQATHGVQTSLAFGFFDRSMEPKHIRTGVDMSKSDMLGLVCLLIDKGLFTSEEYIEYTRLAANNEVRMREKEASAQTGKSITLR